MHGCHAPRPAGKIPEPGLNKKVAVQARGRQGGLTGGSPGVIICTVTQMSKHTEGTDRKAGCCGLPGVPEPGFFKALCDPTRLRILAELAEAGEPRTVSQVAGGLPVDLSVVSRHLATLREAGILESTKEGKEVRYTVRGGVLVATLREFATSIESCCSPVKKGGRP